MDMEWKELNSIHQLEQLKSDSSESYVVIYKHSTRCSISAASINRLERNWDKDEMKNVQTYYLDILNFRPVSNKVEEIFGIQHESPQVLLIKNGKVVYHNSHSGITYQEIAKKISKN